MKDIKAIQPARTYNYAKLRGRIKEKCGTEGSFASQIGRSQAYLCNVFKGTAILGQKDIEKAKIVLEIPESDVWDYFFSH